MRNKFVLLVLAIVVMMSLGGAKAEAHGGYGYGGGTYLSFAYHHPGYWGYYGYPYTWGYPYYWGFPAWGGYYGPAYYSPYGEIRTEVKPSSSKVFVDGDYAGQSDDYDGWWQRMNVQPGKHRIVFREGGFQPYVVDLRVMPGADYHLKYVLQPGQDTMSDQEMVLPQSEREEDRRPYEGYNRYPNENRHDEYDRDHDRDYDRDREYGEQDERDDQYQRGPQNYPDDRGGSDRRPLTFEVSPPDATLYIDGEYYGTADSNQNGEVEVMLPPGTHKIEVVRPGYESFEKQIEVGSNSTDRYGIHLQKK